ncbi:hypothetical protein RB195_007884 [Necator americanus]|uniref:Uncharacterized protein n=1 Tax=Necator americanus TaxID=51031 RepID=A0ABR1BZD7_NECAM
MFGKYISRNRIFHFHPVRRGFLFFPVLMVCHFVNFELHCTHWIIDYIGLCCLGFWVLVAIGVLFCGWFGIRPRRIIRPSAESQMLRRLSRSRSSKRESGSVRWLTSCIAIVVIFCPCLEKETGNPLLCPVCNREMRTIEINSAMDPKLQELFKPPKKLIQEKMAALKKKYDFQQMLVKSLLEHLKKQREKLSQLTKYCQKQTQISKEQAKEMDELKEWVRTAEIKMKESEEDKANLRKELEGMRKLYERFAKDGGYDSSIDKIFAVAGDSRTNDTESMSNLSFTGVFGCGSKTEIPSFLRTNSEADGINSSLGSFGCNLEVSPQMSANGSVASELTTPKMLGLQKKGFCHSEGNLHSSKRTPSNMDTQNPYAEIFNRSSSLHRYNDGNYRVKKGSPSSGRCNFPRLQSKSPTTSGYVTQGKIIPRVNTPSGMPVNKF